jgi:23S rRNA (guanine745-N1)-methyltransferase
VLADVVPLLRCPHCGGDLRLVARTLRCDAGHTFDLARQGHVTLATGTRGVTGDSAAMVAAREAVLGAGHYAPLVAAVAAEAEAAAEDPGADPPAVVDLGAGTGHYLAAVLGHLPGHVGLALDASPYAGRRAARAHPRAGSVVCDLVRPWPVRDGVADVLLDVFAPRNGPEIGRVLRPGGHLVVVTPATDHLAELREPLGLLAVDPRKEERRDAALAPYVTAVGSRAVRARLSLTPDEVLALVGMGPSVRHLDPDGLRGRVRAWTGPVTVTLSAGVTTYRKPW